MHLPVKLGADIFIQSGVIDNFSNSRWRPPPSWIFRLWEFGFSDVLIVWHLCCVPNWVKIYAMVTEIDALMRHNIPFNQQVRKKTRRGEGRGIGRNYAQLWPMDVALVSKILAIRAWLLMLILFLVLLSASLYFSKRGAYWDRLCRDVVGRWLSRACTVAKRCILGL